MPEDEKIELLLLKHFCGFIPGNERCGFTFFNLRDSAQPAVANFLIDYLQKNGVHVQEIESKPFLISINDEWITLLIGHDKADDDAVLAAGTNFKSLYGYDTENTEDAPDVMSDDWLITIKMDRRTIN